MNLPNKLTIIRICLVPVFVICFYIPRDLIPVWNHIAAAVFIIAYITDILDGQIARKRNIVSDFGKLMDPIADKLLTSAALIMLTWEGMIHPLATLIIIAREFAVSGIRLVAAANNTVIAASKLGKLKTVMQCVAIVLILLENPIFGSFGIPMDIIVLWLAVAVTVISFVDYAWKYRQSNTTK